MILFGFIYVFWIPDNPECKREGEGGGEGEGGEEKDNHSGKYFTMLKELCWV